MLKLHKSKKNLFECKVQIEGTTYKKATPRLILYPLNDTKNVFFEGTIDAETCKVVLSPNIDIPKTGKIVLEIIIDDTTLFQPWQSEYEIITEQIKVESVGMTIGNSSGPTIRLVEDVKVEQEKKPIVEVKQVPIPESSPKPIPEIKKEIPIPKKISEIKESVANKDKKLVREFLSSYSSLTESERKKLVEHIDSKDFKPLKESKRWVENTFKSPKSKAAKISMYCYDLEKRHAVENKK